MYKTELSKPENKLFDKIFDEAIREVILNATVHRDYMAAPIQISIYDDKLIYTNSNYIAHDH